MKAIKFSTLLLSVALLLGVGITTVSADAKTVKSEKLTLNMDGKVYDSQKNCKCEKCECGMKKGPKAAMKCGDGKCGDAKKTSPKKMMKCGAGKCGSN
ncbi:MAG: hypothetical protein L3J19_01850 [Sulfurimonas sp.]|nr:hypothetical protein [Sulfurimonas sp.]